MLKLTDAQLKEIAGELECGMKCYVHKRTAEHVSIPVDVLFGIADDELWREYIDKVTRDADNYLELEPFDSADSFQMMEDFIYTIKDEVFSKRLIYALSRPKPFQNFKYEIDYSNYRQNWFDFKTQRTISFVKEQIRTFNEQNP